MRVLIATGGSPHSEMALRFSVYVLQLSRSGAEPTVISVAKRESERPDAVLIVRRALAILDEWGPVAETVVKVGHPAEEIIRQAEQGGYDLVIMGERQHHTLITRFILGSTVERVIEHAPCPVIIAKGRIGPVRRVLLCDSGIDNPSLLDRFTAQVGELINGQQEVTVLHVMSHMSAGPGVRGAQLRAGAEELMQTHAPEGRLLERDLHILEELKMNPTAKVRHGLVVEEILAEMRGGDYDLVVIGAHRGAGWRNILLDDLAHQIIANVDRPVLVVR